MAFPTTDQVRSLYTSRDTQVLGHIHIHTHTRSSSAGKINACAAISCKVQNVESALHDLCVFMCVAHRNAPHCIEYARLMQWSQQRPNEEFDTDKEEHIQWVYEQALKRAQQFGIPVSSHAQW